ncbi:MAG TPA: IspD/TarI family cytidylyltransferase [Abditibacteriaceae bacterium]
MPAAGCGARTGLNGNKILAPLDGQPLLWHTLRGLLDSPEDNRNRPYSVDEVVIAARAEEWDDVRSVWSDVAQTLEVIPEFRLVEGGAARQDSVEAAARAARGTFVAVHDAARPFASSELLFRVCDAARETGAAIPAVLASDSVKVARILNAAPVVEQTLDRSLVWLVQTPQVFRREVLLEAFGYARETGFVGTDCASAVEQLINADGSPRFAVRLVEGNRQNFKVTYAADLERAEEICRAQRN